jgi:hypothetical protein
LPNLYYGSAESIGTVLGGLIISGGISKVTLEKILRETMSNMI